MPFRATSTSIQNYLSTVLIALLLSSCGGGNTSTQGLNNIASISVSGSVGDGPIVGASITIMDAHGTVLAETTSDDTAKYEVEIPEDTSYPLIITASGGIDLVSGTTPDFEMVSLVNSAGETNANINPFSTLIVKAAQEMPGGLNPTNIELATEIIIKHVNFGLDISLVPDPITTPIDKENVATIVKSSEVLAEMIRRTQRTLSTSGSTVDEDSIVEALASDLTDGVIDGTGEENADNQIAAIANIVSGQVLLEALNNNLYVNDSPATTLMDNAILITVPDATDTTNDALLTREQIEQTRISLSTALTLDPSAPVNDVTDLLETLEPGSTPQSLIDKLPADKGDDLEETITMAPYTSDTTLEELNKKVRLEIATSQPPFVVLKADSLSISAEDPIYVMWAARNAKACSASGPVVWYDTGELSGETKLEGLRGETTLTLTCTNDSGLTSSKSITISVTDSEEPSGYEPNNVSDTNIPAGIGIPIDTGSAFPADNNQHDDTQTPPQTPPTSQPTGPASGNGNTSPMISLEWNPAGGVVVGYLVFAGTNQDDITTLFQDMPVNSGSFDPQSPRLEIDPQTELGLMPGDNVCFAVRAYNVDGVSSPSPAVCSII